jgi:hypothetical protein
MAKSGGDAAAKRARELRKEQQKADKRERREALTSQNETIPVETEAALMEEFAALSEKFESDLIPAAQYAEERHRIFVARGIETDDD